MPFNTRNPIPSGDLRDLDDNARNIDAWANDKTKVSHPDRFGVERRTWHGIEQEAQLNIQQAIDAKNAAQEAAMMSGFSKYADTLAQLESGIGTDYIEGDVVMVFQDESRSDTSSIFKIESGVAEFKLTFDKTRQDLLSFTGNIATDAEWSDVPAHSDPAFDVQAQSLADRTEFLGKLSYTCGDRFDFAEIPLAAKTAGWALKLTGQEVNVLRYVPIAEWPALFDGISTYDCAPAINEAITANPGKSVLVPLRMRVAAPVIVKTDYTGLVGIDRNTSQLWRDSGFVADSVYGNNTVAFCVGASPTLEGGGPINGSSTKSPIFANLTVESVSEMSSGAHLYMHTPVDGALRNLYFKNGFNNVHLRSMANTFMFGVHTFSDHAIMTTTRSNSTASIRLSWSRGTFYNNTGFLDQVFVRGTFPPSHTKGHYTSFSVESCDGLWVANCYFGNAAGQNILIQPYVPPTTSEAGKQNNKIVGFKMNSVWVDYANGMVISDATSHDSSIRGVEIVGLSAYGYEGYGTYGIVLNASTAVDVDIRGGRVWDFGREGIDFRKGNHVRIDGIAIRRCNRAGAASTGCIGVNTSNAANGPTHWSITNSALGWQTDGTTLAATGRAIYVGQNCDYFRIKDNDLTGNQSSGVFNGSMSTATDYEISNNFGFKTESRGFSAIVSGTTSVTISHGLDVTPLSGDINLAVSSPASLDFGVMTISNITSTQFTVNVTTAPTGANAINFRWDVKSRG